MDPMRNLIPLALLVFVVAACNLSSKLKPGNSNESSTSSSSSGNSANSGGEPVEKPNPTAAQTAAIAGGQEVKWDQQGITWTLPPNWKKSSVTTEGFTYGGNGAFLIVNISV